MTPAETLRAASAVICGNGVVAHQAAVALRFLLAAVEERAA